MMNQKTIRIRRMKIICIRVKMMARMLRTKSLRRATNRIRKWQQKLKKKVRVPMTS